MTIRETILDNQATIGAAIERGIIPHAIITPGGEWHKRGCMGWWADLLTENENWDTDARKILASYLSYDLIILDAHI